MLRIDNSLFNSDDANYQDTQERQVAALRGFYTEESNLPVVDALDVVEFEDHARVVVTEANLGEVCDWLMDARVYLAFKPVAVVTEDGKLVLLLQ